MGKDEPSKANKLLPPVGKLTNDDVLGILDAVHHAADTDDTTMMRLEGFIPVPTNDPENPKFDEVRMMYLKGALTDKNNPGKPRDYVVVTFRTVMGTAPEPNGGASGPPDG